MESYSCLNRCGRLSSFWLRTFHLRTDLTFHFTTADCKIKGKEDIIEPVSDGWIMRKYMLKRILFSIFSLLVVVMLVMLLVYTMIERSVIFQTDDTWNKKSNNDRIMYEYTQYQKYGYLTYVDYTSFLKQQVSAQFTVTSTIQAEGLTGRQGRHPEGQDLSGERHPSRNSSRSTRARAIRSAISSPQVSTNPARPSPAATAI